MMLVHPPNAPPLVRQRALDLQGSVSTEFLYSRASPLKERPHTYKGLQRGMGLDEQMMAAQVSALQTGAVGDMQYSYATAADLSCAIWQKGPDIATFAPATTDVWASTFGFENTGNLYGLAGRYVLRRISDASWTVAKDFGAGVSTLGATQFYSNAGGSTQLVFVALNGANKAWFFDGATWTQFATFTALAHLVVGVDFYQAHDVNLVRKCNTNADPTNEANWSAANLITVGDKSAPIVSLAKTIGEVILILKTDGVYTLAADNTAHHLFPELSFGPGVDNGRVVGYFENDVYCTYGQTLWRISPDLTIEPIGPDRTLTNSSPVHGRVTAFCGVGGFFGHAGVFNNTDSYLLKLGGFEADPQGDLHRTDAWHGSLSQVFSGKIMRSLQVSAVGAPVNHTRTYAGFDDGSVAWWTNPCTPNPLGCTDAYTWTTSDAFVYLPRFTAANVEDMKALHSLSGMGPNLNGANWFEFEYKTDVGSPTWVPLGTQFNTTREKVAFPPNTVSPLAAFRVKLVSQANTATPQISGVTVWHAWRPDRVMDITVSVNANDGLLMRNGVPLRRTGDVVRDVCQAVVDTPGSVLVKAPTFTDNVSFLDMTEGTDWDKDRGTPTQTIQLRGVSFATLAVYGTYDRLSSYTYDDLALFDYDELSGL